VITARPLGVTRNNLERCVPKKSEGAKIITNIAFIARETKGNFVHRIAILDARPVTN
jgi:hypothetical protein